MAILNVLNNSRVNKALLWGSVGAAALVTAQRLYKHYTKYDVNGKVVLITGASRGLGLVLARLLAARGARMAICARTPEQLGQAKVELEQAGAEVEAFITDVSQPRAVNKLIKDVIKHYGRIDVLINNAGIIQVAPVEALDIGDFEEAMKTNFWGALYTMFAILPHFKKQGEGRVVNIASIGGKIAVPHLLPYTASKFALVGLSEGMHSSLKRHNIKVTTIIPGLMRTGSPRNIDVKGDHEKEYAWFKVSDSSALLSVKAETAAEQIIQALEYGRPEAIISWSTKAATLLQGFAPGWLSGVMSLVNIALPDNAAGGHIKQKGYQSESDVSKAFGKRSNRAAIANNEL